MGVSEGARWIQRRCQNKRERQDREKTENKQKLSIWRTPASCCLRADISLTLFCQLTWSISLLWKRFICSCWLDLRSSKSLSYPIEEGFCHGSTNQIASYNTSALLFIGICYIEVPLGPVEWCGASIRQIKRCHDKTWCMGNPYQGDASTAFKACSSPLGDVQPLCQLSFSWQGPHVTLNSHSNYIPTPFAALRFSRKWGNGHTCRFTMYDHVYEITSPCWSHHWFCHFWFCSTVLQWRETVRKRGRDEMTYHRGQIAKFKLMMWQFWPYMLHSDDSKKVSKYALCLWICPHWLWSTGAWDYKDKIGPIQFYTCHFCLIFIIWSCRDKFQHTRHEKQNVWNCHKCGLLSTCDNAMF